MEKKENLEKQVYKKNPKDLILRYLILLGLMFALPLIHKIFSPLTIHPVTFLLKLLYEISLEGNIITINNQVVVQIISACIAGSAYLLFLILNLSISMNIKKRICSILTAFTLLLILNILRIFFLAILAVNNFKFFDITHKLFWYGLSTIMVIGIWFLITKIFSIKEVPLYSDLKYLIKNIKRKQDLKIITSSPH